MRASFQRSLDEPVELSDELLAAIRTGLASTAVVRAFVQKARQWLVDVPDELLAAAADERARREIIAAYVREAMGARDDLEAEDRLSLLLELDPPVVEPLDVDDRQTEVLEPLVTALGDRSGEFGYSFWWHDGPSAPLTATLVYERSTSA